MDESIFHTKKHSGRYWAPRGNPIVMKTPYLADGFVSAFACISQELGLVHTAYKLNAGFNHDDMLVIYKDIRAKVNSDIKIALFMDNASFHTSVETKAYIQSRDDFEFIYNVTYRPDMMGVEFFWSHAKRKYQAKVDLYRATMRTFNLMMVAKDSVDYASKYASRCAARGWKGVKNAKPVLPEENEMFSLEFDMRMNLE
jgi:hypothetical protein